MMMNKKNFKNSPALAFIKPQDNTQYEPQEVTQQPERKGYIKTQGRKGHKKPRINLAFDSDAFLDQIRTYSEREGKSITQFVNDAVAYYIENVKIDKK
jgi:hypothetical protein